MLTIQNTHKIQQKTLGKKNFYVVRVEEVITYDAQTFENNAKYIFELSNRKYAITVTLNREVWNTNTYKLQSSTGHVLYITLLDIRNMDIFIDKLRLVALG